MKKLILLLALLVIPTLAQAQTTSSGLSSDVLNWLNQNWNDFNPSEGILYAVREHQVKEITTLNLLSYKNVSHPWIHLDIKGGYAPSDWLGGGPSYDFGNLSQFNISIPFLSQIDINIGYAYGYLFNDDSRRTDGGPMLTGSWKF